MVFFYENNSLPSSFLPNSRINSWLIELEKIQWISSKLFSLTQDILKRPPSSMPAWPANGILRLTPWQSHFWEVLPNIPLKSTHLKCKYILSPLIHCWHQLAEGPVAKPCCAPPPTKKNAVGSSIARDSLTLFIAP